MNHLVLMINMVEDQKIYFIDLSLYLSIFRSISFPVKFREIYEKFTEYKFDNPPGPGL